MEADSLSAAEKNPPRLRWYQPTPGRLLVALLAVEGVLLLSEPLQWFAFNEKKGWTVLIAVATVATTMAMTGLWLLLALLLHWRFQFSLRSLLIAVIVVAIPCSWLAVEMKGAREQRVAVEAIRNLRGGVGYDDGTRSIIPVRSTPVRLRRLLGDDFFQDATDVDFSEDSTRAHATDAALRHLKGLPQLRGLGLANTQVTDTGLEHLKGLTQLRDLDLVNTEATDAGMEHLKGLSRLRVLILYNTKVTDAGLVHLQGLSQLEELHLIGTNVTDQGVSKLQKALPKCEIQH